MRWGVFVTFAADTEYVRKCFAEYGLVTDASGNYAALYKPFHLIGLELAISAASVGLRGDGVKLTRDVAADQVVTWNDVAARDSEAVRVRREMEQRSPSG